MGIVIRQEEGLDREGVRAVNLAAFGQTEEADIVDLLRENCDDLLSLVALDDGQVKGHILFSPVQATCGHAAVRGFGLAPMAVYPDCQRQGIGSRLIRQGIALLEGAGCPFVIVLGHPDYYPRFGFEPASRYGLQCQWEVPDEAFMVRVLNPDQVKDIKGVARYRSEFDAAM